MSTIIYTIMERHIKLSETRQFKAIFPNTLNANDILFGGQAMLWMDEVAYITATRFTRQRMVTINTENVKFLKAVSPDSLVEVVGVVLKAESVRLKVKVEIYVEEMYGNKRDMVVEGVFVFAAVDENKKPIKIDYSFLED